MRRPRSRRVEEQRARKRIAHIVIASIAILTFLAFVGPYLLVKASIFFGNTKPDTPTNSSDTTIPFAPVIEPLVSATGSARIVINGYAEPESTVQLLVNNRKVKEILIDNNGTFTISNIALRPGNNSITATTTDAAGNVSKKAPMQQIAFLNNPPKLEITEPSDGMTTGDEKIEIQGITDKGNGVTINGRFVSVASDGSFRHSYKLSDGENKITIIATDQADTQTTVERTVTRG